MALESVQISEIGSVPRRGDSGEYSSSDVQGLICKSNVQDSEHLGDFLNDFESYWQDINDRLIVSRLVSDSVIKGMVNAVSQDSAEMVSAKQIEVTGLEQQLLEGHLVQQLQEEVQVIVMQNVIQCVREEYERQLLGSRFYGSKVACWRDSLKIVSSICQDLDSVQNSLINLEKSSSNGSVETDYHRFFTNIRSKESSVSLPGNFESSNLKHLPENFESSHLKHLPQDGLYSHFRDVIADLKIDHERKLQKVTDDYFSLKREFLKERELLKERESFLPLKSKDFDVLRKKILDAISKLNHILLENEDFSVPLNFSGDRLDNLHLEGLVRDKEREDKCLSLELSEAKKKVMQHIPDEACLSDMVGDLKKTLEEANFEASVKEEVYKCLIKELASQIEHDGEENSMKSIITQEILATVHEEAIREIEDKLGFEYGEFSNMQTMIAQEISGNIFQEALKDMEVQIKTLEKKCMQQEELIICLECERSKMERTLALEAKEKLILMQKTLELEELVKTKDDSLITEKEQFKKELQKMTDNTEHQEALISRINSELGELKADLEDSLQQIDQYKDQMAKLTKEFELAKLDSERTILQERHNTGLFLNARDREYKENFESALHAIQEMMEEAFVIFELKTIENIKHNNLRLQNSTVQLNSLIKKVSIVRRAGIIYKQRLERRSTDLQKAETEVDLLGDEVETLQGLLEKIYIALDHYSPILQHYPGIMEILKLIERKLYECRVHKVVPCITQKTMMRVDLKS